MTVNVLGPDRKVCDVCQRDGPRNGMDIELNDGEDQRLFICVVCLQQMVEDCST